MTLEQAKRATQLSALLWRASMAHIEANRLLEATRLGMLAGWWQDYVRRNLADSEPGAIVFFGSGEEPNEEVGKFITEAEQALGMGPQD